MRLAGPIHPEERSTIGQAFLVGQLAGRIRARVVLHRQQLATSLLGQTHSGHVCDQAGERRDLLIEMIRASLRRGRPTLLIHGRRSNADMLRYLQGRRLPPGAIGAGRAFVMLPAGAVWPSRRPDPSNTMELVDALRSTPAFGKEPVQIISDANHRFITDANMDGLFALEEWWNRARLPAVRIACIYRGADVTTPHVRDRFQRTHSTRTQPTSVTGYPRVATTSPDPYG